jgi:hypothetical protein
LDAVVPMSRPMTVWTVRFMAVALPIRAR